MPQHPAMPRASGDKLFLARARVLERDQPCWPRLACGPRNLRRERAKRNRSESWPRGPVDPTANAVN
eukprot:6275132-Alexandrium_andersonii.AAC.1